MTLTNVSVSNCKYSPEVAYVVQARMSFAGWVDCRTAETRVEAEIEERVLLDTDLCWMAQTRERKTRIVLAR